MTGRKPAQAGFPAPYFRQEQEQADRDGEHAENPQDLAVHPTKCRWQPWPRPQQEQQRVPPTYKSPVRSRPAASRKAPRAVRGVCAIGDLAWLFLVIGRLQTRKPALAFRSNDVRRLDDARPLDLGLLQAPSSAGDATRLDAAHQQRACQGWFTAFISSVASLSAATNCTPAGQSPADTTSKPGSVSRAIAGDIRHGRRTAWPR